VNFVEQRVSHPRSAEGRELAKLFSTGNAVTLQSRQVVENFPGTPYAPGAAPQKMGEFQEGLFTYSFTGDRAGSSNFVVMIAASQNNRPVAP